MRFRRFGSNFQPVIQSATDLYEAVELDPALWAVNTAPTQTLHLDAQLLEWLDEDGDQRITAATFKKAVLWLQDVLKHHEAVDQESDVIDPAHLNDACEDACRIKAIVAIMGQGSDTSKIGLSSIRALREQLESRSTSGVGVLAPEAAESNEALSDFITRIVALMGGVEHPAGGMGMDQNTLDTFIAEAGARLNWWHETQGEAGDAIHVLGDETEAAYELLMRVEARVLAFFEQCKAMRLCEDQGIAYPALEIALPGAGEEEDAHTKAAWQAWIAERPLARVNADGLLPLDHNLNPYDGLDLLDLVEQLNRSAGLSLDKGLDETAWARLVSQLDGYRDWRSREAGTALAGIEIEALEADLALAQSPELAELMQVCRDCVMELDHVKLAERLSLYQAHLLRLSNNFISLRDLYDEEHAELFSEGELVLDGRRFRPALRVLDRKEHQKMVANGGIFVMYLELSDTNDQKKYEVAVPVTRGMQGNIAIGKRGVFEHVNGEQWVARITALVEEPISFAGAAVAPFKRLSEAITKKLEVITQSSEKELDQAGAKMVSQVHDSSVAAGEKGAEVKIKEQQVASTSAMPAGTTVGPKEKPGMGGAVFGGAVAFAALGSSAAYVLKTLSEVAWWQIALGLVGALALVLVPALILVGIRLRSRDLSVLLEGSGWGVNDRMRLVRSQALMFTRTPRLPLGALLEGGTGVWRVWVLTAIVLLLLVINVVLFLWFFEVIQWPLSMTP